MTCKTTDCEIKEASTGSFYEHQAFVWTRCLHIFFWPGNKALTCHQKEDRSASARHVLEEIKDRHLLCLALGMSSETCYTSSLTRSSRLAAVFAQVDTFDRVVSMNVYYGLCISLAVLSIAASCIIITLIGIFSQTIFYTKLCHFAPPPL